MKSQQLVSELLQVEPTMLKASPNYRTDTELWEFDGSVYCAPVGWKRPPAKYTWRHAGYAKGRPIFIKTGER